MLVFDDVTAHHVSFILQEEQLQSSEREKLSKNRELAYSQQQLRQKVDVLCLMMSQPIMYVLYFRKNSCSQVRERNKQSNSC